MTTVSDTESNNICRICLSDDTQEGTAGTLLKSACNCCGTNGHMHEQCLKECIESRFDDKCEICGEKYKVAIRWQMPSVVASINATFREMPRQLFVRLLIFTIFSIVFALQVTVIIKSVDYRGWAQYTVTCLNCAVALTALTECVHLVNTYRRSNVKAVIGVQTH